MAAIHNSHSITTLIENYRTVVEKSQLVLNDHLTPVSGRFSSCAHDRILKLTLQHLQQIPADSVPCKRDLIEMRSLLEAYVRKIDLASKISAKTRKPSAVFDKEIVEKISQRISELHTEVASREDSKEPDQETLIQNLIP